MTRSFLKVLLAALGFSLLFVVALRSQEAAPPASAEKPKEAPTSPTPSPTEKPKEGATAQQPAPTVKPKILFQLPLRGAPAARIDGGSRGNGVSLICLTALVPDSTALTVLEQPSLFWYQSQPADVPFELTILADNTIQPLLQVQLPNTPQAGIQRLNLAEHNVKLAADVEYEWVIALVVDPESRSKDVIASGWIKRVEPSPLLQSQLAKATKEELPALYAGEGLWLDTLTALSDLIDAQPKDRTWQDGRAALLEQVGLTNAAAYVVSQTTSD
jgi:uncharacterized protein DUF928